MNSNITNFFQVRVQVRVQKFLFFKFEFEFEFGQNCRVLRVRVRVRSPDLGERHQIRTKLHCPPSFSACTPMPTSLQCRELDSRLRQHLRLRDRDFEKLVSRHPALILVCPPTGQNAVK